MCNIDTRVLNPIQKELEPYFEKLTIKKIKGTGKRKRFIDKISFSFMPQDDFKKDGTKTFPDSIE